MFHFNSLYLQSQLMGTLKTLYIHKTLKQNLISLLLLVISFITTQMQLSMWTYGTQDSKHSMGNSEST